MLIIFNVIFGMLLWSYWSASLGEPGAVPKNWGYDFNSQGIVKRRFCLTCQCFKPERCHHCSACNRCVLNMDHHCLWLNNCIGFNNRKAFMLTLFYAQIITIFIEVTLLKDFVTAVQWGFSDDFQSKYDDDWKKQMLVLITYILNSIILVVITIFLKFHWMLATQNKTTIENIEHCDLAYWSKYDVGKQENLK